MTVPKAPPAKPAPADPRLLARLVCLVCLVAAVTGLAGGGVEAASAAGPYIETPALADQVAAGTLPPVAERLPQDPAVVRLSADPDKQPGRHGGDLRTLMGRTKDTRIVYVYAYARLVAFNRNLEIEPDLLRAVEVEDDRIFTLHLRPGHKWSDGHPFTSEDFRYFWENVCNEPELMPFGPPADFLVDGEPPEVDILDPLTVRYRWRKPNPGFLPYLAGARPYQLFRPAHYLRRFHHDHADPEALAERVADSGLKTWARLHNYLDNQNRFDNPDLPVLQPWMVETRGPAERFVFKRNPFYHRVDENGRQLPYIDRLLVSIADPRIIPAKTGSGESDLQARYLRFDNYTFLKQGEQRNGYTVRLWETGKGSRAALYPNLNANDPVWRQVLRDVRFRRALSLAIHREEINQVIFYGLAQPSNNTLLPRSPLWRPAFRDLWAAYDPARANALLDEMGLTERGSDDIRRLPDGRPLQIVVETAGESTEETDMLQLIGDSWRKIGVALFTKPSQREVLRNRVYSGDAIMVIASGVDNGIATADFSPLEFVPVEQVQYQWPKWGQYHQTQGEVGEAPDLKEALQLLDLLQAWRTASGHAGRAAAWQDILRIHAEQQFTLGTVNNVPQPVVVNTDLRNVPEKGLYNYDPGAHFGIHRPDTFWFDRSP